MIDHGISCIYSDDVTETSSQFKLVLDDAFNSEDGLTTIVFCRYFEYKIITEVLYVIKKEDNFIFIEYPSSFNMLLDKTLQPTVVEWHDAQTFSKIMLGSDNAIIIEPIVDIHGNLLNICCFNEPDIIDFGKKWVDFFSDLVIDEICLDPKILLLISDDYLTIRKEKFQIKMDQVLDSGEVYDGMDENPFAEQFYNNPEFND